MRRHWRMVQALQEKPRSVHELAELSDCHVKTIRRDLAAMQSAGVGVNRNGQFYSMGEVMKKCTECGKEFTGNRAAQALNGHMRAHGTTTKRPRVKAVTASGNGAPAPISTELFSVIKGDIHLRGCEFGSGFLVLNGETLRSYPSLRDAIADAEASVAASKIPAQAQSAFA